MDPFRDPPQWFKPGDEVAVEVSGIGRLANLLSPAGSEMSSGQQLVWDPFQMFGDPDPYPLYRRLRDESPVYYNGERDLWALSRFEDIQTSLRDWELFSSARGVDLVQGESGISRLGGFLDADPPRHDVLRKIVSRDFSPKAIAAREGEVRGEVCRLLGACIESGEADAATDFACALPVAMIARILGIPNTDVPQLREWAFATLERTPGTVAVPTQAREAADAIREYVEQLVRERRSNPKDDLLSKIAQARPDGRPLSHDEVRGTGVLLVVAGIETTASLISNSIMLLAQYPDERAKLLADPSGIPTGIEELLRFESPIQANSRVVTRDVTLHDRTIPAGARVALIYASANRDERQYEYADRLFITRPVGRHLAFGDGIHFCIGAPLARLEGRVALEELLRCCPDYELAGEPRRAALESRVLSSLPVEFKTLDSTCGSSATRRARAG